MNRLPDILESCISEIDTQAYWFCGSKKELSNDLARKGSDATMVNMRYPLVFLPSNYKEITNKQNTKATASDVKVYIITQQPVRNASIQSRYDGIFQTVLYPIYEEIINELKKGNYFINFIHSSENVPRNIYGLTLIADDLDAIEITFKNLIYYLKKS